MKKVPLSMRAGFEKLALKLLYMILYPFFHCKCLWTEELKTQKEPVVFVCNHYEFFGPFAAMTSLGVNMRAWSNEQMMNPEAYADELITGVSKVLTFLSRKSLYRFVRVLSRFTSFVLHSLGMITVDRANSAKLLSTMRASISALEKGEHLLVFPETGYPTYSLDGVTEFFPGFAMLGEFYYRRTKKSLAFCPVYIDKANRKLRFGKLINWQPGENMQKQSERVSDEIRQSILNMAGTTRSAFHEKPTRAATVLASLRLLLIPQFLYLVRVEKYLYAGILLPVSVVLDRIRGRILRHCRVVSRYDRKLDFMADWLTEITILLCMRKMDRLFLHGLVLLVLKEITLLLLDLYRVKKIGRRASPIRSEKMLCTLLCACCFLLLPCSVMSDHFGCFCNFLIITGLLCSFIVHCRGKLRFFEKACCEEKKA